MDFSKLDHRILRYIDEKTMVKLLNFDQYFSFHKFFGFPLKKLDFFYTHGYRLNLKNPVTLNEKIVYRQLFERDPLLSVIVDRDTVREYVKEKIGEQYLIPVLQIADSFDDIDFSQLPDQYILKMNHASGRNVIFNKGKLLFKQRVDDRDYNREELKKIIDAWFVEKYRYQQLIWFVQPIKRRVLIEKILIDNNGEMPKDYKLFVFGGKVEFISVIRGMYSNYTENLYSRNWEAVDFTFADPDPIDIDQEIPLLANELIAVAEKLASDFTFMRVDLYVLGSKIYFGELTPCHASGQDGFDPIEYDEYYGNKWKDHTRLMRKA